MSLLFWALGLAAFVIVACFLLRSEARQDRLIADARNATRGDRDFR